MAIDDRVGGLRLLAAGLAVLRLQGVVYPLPSLVGLPGAEVVEDDPIRRPVVRLLLLKGPQEFTNRELSSHTQYYEITAHLGTTLNPPLGQKSITL